MSDKNFYVYKHTSPSNKVYIGITINPKKRWSKSHYKYNEHFNNAINKYGWDNFKHEILFSGLTVDEAKQKEIELIAYYDSTNPSKGYNISLGGDIISYVTREKISKILKEKGISEKTIEYINNNSRKINQYDLQGNFIKTWNSYYEIKQSFKNASKATIYACCIRKERNKSSKNLSYLGYQWRFTDDCNDITEYKRRKQDYSVIEKPICEIDNNGNIIGEYISIQKCSELLNLNPSSISSVCLGRYATTKGHIFIYKDECNKENIQKHLSKMNNRVFAPRKKVCEIDKNGNILKIYNSVRECAKENNIKSEAQVSGVCNGRFKSAKGKLFRYYTE